MNRIIDSIYLIPVLLDHLDKPTANTRAILKANNIDSMDIIEARKIRTLLEYHLHIIQNNYQPNYPLLRQGLREYFNEYLYKIFNQLDIRNKTWYMLDYGAGSGQMSQQFLKTNPDSQVLQVDKEIIDDSLPSLCVDFEADPKWYHGFKDTFDLVVVSELLHCKTLNWQEYIIKSSIAMLKPGGRLIIVENIDHTMEYRISKIKTTPHPVVMWPLIRKLMKPYKVKLIKQIHINQHYIYYYEKI